MPGRKEKGMRKKGREGSWKHGRTKMVTTEELGPHGHCQQQAAIRLCVPSSASLSPWGIF